MVEGCLADWKAVNRFLFHDPKHAARNRNLWEQRGRVTAAWFQGHLLSGEKPSRERVVCCMKSLVVFCVADVGLEEWKVLFGPIMVAG